MSHTLTETFERFVTPRVTDYAQMIDTRNRIAVEDLAAMADADEAGSRTTQAGKRGVDLLISGLALLLLLPLLGLITLVLAMSGRGPVLHRRAMVGRGGRRFNLLTFNVDDRNDRLGEWIRQYRFDVLPKWINLFTGDLSLVGPRAHSVQEAARLARMTPGYRARQAVRPGLLSWSTVQSMATGGYIKADDELTFDRDYIAGSPLLMDCLVIVMTMKLILQGMGGVPRRSDPVL